MFLELSNVEAAGNKIFLAGNLHTPTTTLYSILLATEDAGKTWIEPHPRIRFAGPGSDSVHRFPERLDFGRQPAERAARSVSAADHRRRQDLARSGPSSMRRAWRRSNGSGSIRARMDRC